MRGVRGFAAMLCCVLFQLPLCAQGDASHCNRLKFTLPFQLDPQDASKLKEAQLYESSDGKSNWKLVARIGPNDSGFALQVPREGEYWYLLRTIETSGQAYPPQLDRLPPNVQVTKVVVDTAPPRIDFRELPGRGEQVSLSWNITDEYLDLSTIRLDYLNASNQWVPITIRQQARGETSLQVPARGKLELRLSAADQAKNQEAKTLTINLGGAPPAASGGAVAGAGIEQNRERDYARTNQNNNDGWDHGSEGTGSMRRSTSLEDAGSGQRDTRYVNKDTFNLNYNLEQVGPSGAYVEAFYQSDSQWLPCGNKKVSQEGSGKLEVKLPREGSFGMLLQVRSGFDNTATKPRASTNPDLWICLDKTLPKVSDVQALPGRGVNMGKLKILWRANDANLAAQPIKIEYRDVEDADKQWQLINDNLENSGSFIWTVPPRGYRYVIRVSAVDKARNWGEAITPEVIIDVAQPKVRIVDIDP